MSLPSSHAVLGTGMVGQAIARRLARDGHAVVMGARSPDNAQAAAFVADVGSGAAQGTFADAADSAEVIWLAVGGAHAETVLAGIPAAALDGKVLVDLTNPLDFSQGMPPTLFVQGRDSLAERVQRAAPGARVVKTLNTMNCELMVDPARLADPGDVLLSGDDAEAKAVVSGILASWGWAAPIDLGGLDTARGAESWLPLWIRLWGALGTPDFNLKIVR